MGPALDLSALTDGQRVPLHEVSARCDDERLPALSGAWVLGCGPGGTVDRALSLESGRLIRLSAPLPSPGWGAGLVFQPGLQGGLFALTEDGAIAVPGTRLMERLVSPVALDGLHIAALDADHVQAFPQEAAARTLYAAHPAGWYPPALAWPFAAWVEDAGGGDEDVVQIDLSARGARTVLAGGPGHQRHVVGSGAWLAWVEPEAVVVRDTRDGAERRIPAKTGFSAPPSLWEDIVCFETRAVGGAVGGIEVGIEVGIDVRCSDGLSAGGPGDQRWPSRWSRWLIYREGETVYLRTATPP